MGNEVFASYIGKLLFTPMFLTSANRLGLGGAGAEYLMHL